MTVAMQKISRIVVTSDKISGVCTLCGFHIEIDIDFFSFTFGFTEKKCHRGFDDLGRLDRLLGIAAAVPGFQPW